MFLLVLLVLALIWFKLVPLWTNSTTSLPNIENVESNAIALTPNEFIPNSPVTTTPPVDLNSMLSKGIKTKIGVVKSQAAENYSTLNINNKPIAEIQAQSPIELTSLFAIESMQIFLIAYNQGGNECAVKYQFVTITDAGYKLSALFGNCLPLKNFTQDANKININFPSNSQYASEKDFIVYQYKNTQVKQIVKDKTDAYYLKRYARLSTKGIMALAKKDGCASDGILNYDNACNWGKKYCTMFKALKNPVKDADYKTLHDFCN